jgi:hypothetical protein
MRVVLEYAVCALLFGAVFALVVSLVALLILFVRRRLGFDSEE